MAISVTKKHMEWWAHEIALTTQAGTDARNLAVQMAVRFFKDHNPRFDEERFLERLYQHAAKYKTNPTRKRRNPATRNAVTVRDALSGRYSIQGRYVSFDPYDGHEITESESYEAFKDRAPEDATHFMPDVLSGSDYSGGTVERANYKVFLEEFENVEGIVDVYGGHGTYAVAIPLDLEHEEIASTLEGLEDYPVIDEEAVSELEMEKSDEAWESWAESDYRSELTNKFPEYEDDIDEMDLREIFENARESINVYWEPETGGEMHVDVRRVAAATDLSDLGLK